MPSTEPAVVNAIAARIRDFMHRHATIERNKQWRKWVADMRSQHPAAFPVRVVRRPMKKHWGLTSLNGPLKHRSTSNTHFLIVISSELPNQVAWMILLHEWAHALTWDTSRDAEVDHDDAWGIAYAKLWHDNHGDADFAREE
jgi:hypothetical protein